MCGDCYAKKAVNTYPESCLFNLAGEINFKVLPVEKIISDIEDKISDSKTKIRFIRFNEAGDFYSYDSFLKANEIATYFKKKYGIVTYTYTHNIELEEHIKEIDNSNIVLNYSYDVRSNLNLKKCIVIDKKDLRKYFSKEYVVCNGSCFHCSYCKNKKDTRTVVFVNHKSKSIEKILEEVLTEEELIKLESIKAEDYSNFLLDLI